MEFSGKTAFVTGAANGIGLGICRALARNGVNLVLADIEQAALEKARSELATCNVRSRAIEVDVSDAAAFERAADQAESEFGNIHFLFNNAGITLGGGASLGGHAAAMGVDIRRQYIRRHQRNTRAGAADE